MKKSRFSEHQIIDLLKETDAGIPVPEICRKHGISRATFYQWKSKYGGMEASDIKKMRTLETQLAEYKRMYAELAHENYALREVITKKL